MRNRSPGITSVSKVIGIEIRVIKISSAVVRNLPWIVTSNKLMSFLKRDDFVSNEQKTV